MSRKLTAVFVVLLVATAGVATATAQSGGGVIDGMFADDGSLLDTLEGIRDGFVGRVTDTITGATSDRDVGDMADDLRTEYNSHSTAYETWANRRTSADTTLDVLELTLTEDGESETLYLVADVANNNYQNTSIVNTTDRTVDESCELQGAATRNAADELSEFRDRFVEDDRNVTSDYLAAQGSRYGGKVDCSFGTEGL